MKKTLSLILAVLFAASAALALTPAASAVSVSVTVNGSVFSFKKATPYVQGSSIMLPAEDSFIEAMGCSLTKNGGEYVITNGAKEVRAVADSRRITVNGNYVAVNDPTRLKNGLLCLPAAEFLTGLAVSFKISGTAVSITAGREEARVKGLINGAPVDVAETWKLYSQAQDARAAKRYTEAISAYEKILPNLAKDNDTLNLAVVFGRLAECYVGVGKYPAAAEAFRQSGKYWDINGKDAQAAQGARTKAWRLTEEVSLYLKTDDLSLSAARTHGESFETKNGIVLGYTHNGSPDTYETSSAKRAGMWLKYFNYGDSLKNWPDAVERAKSCVVQLAVQPMKGLSSINDATTRTLAQEIRDSGGSFIIRFAGEMNDPTSSWYGTGAEYKAAYIKFAKIFREVAPSVPLLWAPNFFPTDGVEDYYPGDEWVDYVGLSSYFSSKHFTSQEINWGYDLFGTGLTTSRWSQQIDFLYNIYGGRKPFIIAEGAASYKDKKDGADITSFAADSILDFYTYLPMRYPNLKYATYFNISMDKTKYLLTDKRELINAYNTAISDDCFLSSYADSAPKAYVSFDALGPTKTIPAKTQQLTAYIKTADEKKPASVVYEVNGTVLGTKTKAPYAINCDFTKYENKLVTVKVTAKDSAGKTLLTNSFTAKVAVDPGYAGFKDVHEPDYFAEPVKWAVERGVTKGTDAKHFSPDAACTRSQVVTFLWRTAGQPEPEGAENPFRDVKESDYFYKAVLWAVEKNITYGTSDTTFSPGAACTRGQIVTFLWRSNKEPETDDPHDPEAPDPDVTESPEETTPDTPSSPFADVKAGDFFFDAVLWAVERKITVGTDGTHFSPTMTCSRGQIVTFLYRSADR